MKRRFVAPAVVAMAALCATTLAEPLPSQLRGAWKITHILPTNNTACWNSDQAQKLVGTTLVYGSKTMAWRDGDVPVDNIVTRTLTTTQFSKENPGAAFEQLGIRAAALREVDFQHADADITGSTTEVPGDSVLMVSPMRIVVSACGVYFEAVRKR